MSILNDAWTINLRKQEVIFKNKGKNMFTQNEVEFLEKYSKEDLKDVENQIESTMRSLACYGTKLKKLLDARDSLRNISRKTEQVLKENDSECDCNN